MLLDRISPDMIIEELTNKEMFLPLIQRGFRWKEDRIEKFFDSLVKRVPVGLILVYEHDGSFKLMARKFFEKFGQETEAEQYKFELLVPTSKLLVLDGQQRLQALYIGLKGTFYDQSLYHNVLLDYEKLQEVSFRFEKEKDTSFEENGGLYVKVPILYQITKDYIANKTHSRPQNIEKFKSITSTYGMDFSNDNLEKIFDYIDGSFMPAFFVPEYFQRIIRFQVVKANDVAGNNKLKNLLEIFVRFNTGGLKLEKSDLMFSILKAYGWQDVEYGFNALSKLTNVSKDLLMKALVVATDMSARTDIYETVNFVEQLKNTYSNFDNTLKIFFDRLLQITQVPERIFRKFNLLIPAVYFMSKTGYNKPLSRDLIEYLLLIVCNSNLRSDYYIDELVEVIKENLDGKESNFPLETIKEKLRKWKVDVDIDDKSLNKDPLLTFSLIQRSNWSPLVVNNKISVDHIFPEARSDEIPVEDSVRKWIYVQSIWNKYVVFLGDNIKKNDVLPEEYFVGDKAKLLKTYILTEENDLLKKQSFLKLLEWRRNRIIECFDRTLGIQVKGKPELEDKTVVK